MRWETREERNKRLHATKVNAKKRKLKLRYAKPKVSPELKASKAEAAKLACHRELDAWLLRPAVAKILKEYPGEISRNVRYALRDIYEPTE